jgi:hypothetical protein
MLEKYQNDLKGYKTWIINLELVAKEEVSSLEKKLENWGVKIDDSYGF